MAVWENGRGSEDRILDEVCDDVDNDDDLLLLLLSWLLLLLLLSSLLCMLAFSPLLYSPKMLVRLASPPKPRPVGGFFPINPNMAKLSGLLVVVVAVVTVVGGGTVVVTVTGVDPTLD